MVIDHDFHLHTNLSLCAHKDATFDFFLKKAEAEGVPVQTALLRYMAEYGTNIGPKNPGANKAPVFEASYSTLPKLTDDGYAYEHTYENPHPGVDIKSIEYISCASKQDVEVDYTFEF